MKEKAPSRWFRSVPFQGLLVALFLTVLFCGLRRTAFFAEHAELPAYDISTRLVWPWKAGHGAIVLVTIQDQSLGWPLGDDKLAEALERMAAAEPVVIGMDLIRDKYLDGPQSPGANRLRQAGLDDRIVWLQIESARERGETDPSSLDLGSSPPPFIAELADEAVQARKVALSTFPVDGTLRSIIRRGTVVSWADNSPRFSLAAMLAWRHQESSGDTGALDRLRVEIGTLSCTAGGYWLKDSDGECAIGSEFLLKPVSGAARRFRTVTLGDFLDNKLSLEDGMMPVFSLADVMEADPATVRRALQGRIVLFGNQVTGVKDEIAVVGDPELRGVKVHALATAQLIRELEGEKPIRVFSDGLEDAVVAISCLLALAMLAIPRLPLAGRGIAGVLLTPLLIFASGLGLLRSGFWLPTAAPMLAGATTGLGGLILLWRKTSGERATYLKLMNSHLGPEVTARVLARNELLVAGMEKPPETFEATALFGDLLGYSAASQYFQENHRPETFFRWLNDFLRPAVEITGRHGGFVKQFAGDGIFVIFGFPPETGGGHAQRSVECARELALLVPKLNRELAAGLPRYYVRMGIYTGEMHASTVGGGRHTDYSFLGPTINKAARLESIDKERFDHERFPARILISGNTRELLEQPMQAVAYRDGPIIVDKRLPPEQVWEIKIEIPAQEPASGASS